MTIYRPLTPFGAVGKKGISGIMIELVWYTSLTLKIHESLNDYSKFKVYTIFKKEEIFLNQNLSSEMSLVYYAWPNKGTKPYKIYRKWLKITFRWSLGDFQSSWWHFRFKWMIFFLYLGGQNLYGKRYQTWLELNLTFLFYFFS